MTTAPTEERARALLHARSAGGRCEVCGRPGHSLQHRVKRSQGGTWHPSNLLRVCGDGTRYCHGWIEAHPRHAMALGYWVRAGTDPATVPAYLLPGFLTRGWWTVDPDACFGFVHDPPAGPEVRAALLALHTARLGDLPNW